MLGISSLTRLTLSAAAPAPLGLVLYYTFEREGGGLIRDKSPFSLHAPIGNLELFAPPDGEPYLLIKPDQSLTLPPSSLLNPRGFGWVATIKFYAEGDGLIFSQGTPENHLAIYIENGAACARIKQGNTIHVFKEENKIVKEGPFTHRIKPYNCLRKWTTATLHVTPSVAFFSVNRNRIESIQITDPVVENLDTITLGHNPSLDPVGFSGKISGLKLLRQPL